MKSTKQIREQFDLITEKEEKEDRKLSALVRAGLYDAKKLPALKKALEKSADKITSQEKRMLVNLLDSLISQVVSDDQVYRKVRQNVHSMNEAKMDTYSKFDPRYKAGWPTDKEMPSVLILKRKAIRVYPDNQKVALYYSQALDKYVTIPYNDIQMGLNEAEKPKEDDDEKENARTNARINKALKRNSKYKKVSTILKTGKVPPETDTTASNKRFNDVSTRLGGGIEGAMGAFGVKLHHKIKDGLRARDVEKAVRARKAAQNDPNSSRNIRINATKAARAAKDAAAQKSTLEENSLVGRIASWALTKISKGTGKGVGKSTGKGLGKGAGKTKARGRTGLAGAIGTGIGAAAGGGGGGSGSGSSAPDTSSTRNYNFSAKPSTSSSFVNRASSTASQERRDATLNRKSQAAVIKESSVLDIIKSIVENDISEQTVRFNENEITINNTVAKKLLNVYESVNKTNKKKMEQMLNESATSFNKVLTFAVRQ